MSKGGYHSATTTHPDLRLSKLLAMADAMSVPRLSFLKTVIEESVRLRHLGPEGKLSRRRPLPKAPDLSSLPGRPRKPQ